MMPVQVLASTRQANTVASMPFLVSSPALRRQARTCCWVTFGLYDTAISVRSGTSRKMSGRRTFFASSPRNFSSTVISTFCLIALAGFAGVGFVKS